MITEFELKYLIKILKKEKGSIKIFEKLVFSNKKTFKNGFAKVIEKYKNIDCEILTFEKVRRGWYECPKPKIRLK